jgi:hypothetical protein
MRRRVRRRRKPSAPPLQEADPQTIARAAAALNRLGCDVTPADFDATSPMWQVGLRRALRGSSASADAV